MLYGFVFQGGHTMTALPGATPLKPGSCVSHNEFFCHCRKKNYYLFQVECPQSKIMCKSEILRFLITHDPGLRTLLAHVKIICKSSLHVRNIKYS